jgi:hypothetical protein
LRRLGHAAKLLQLAAADQARNHLNGRTANTP